MTDRVARFRFYAELNDFLPPKQRQKSITYPLKGIQTVKDAIEGIGIPHVEVDMIIANQKSVGFDYIIQNTDYISVYPVFEKLDISDVTRLVNRPLRNTTFILDVHLGKLARFLRMLGFNSSYKNDFEDAEIIEISLKEKRIILTRDTGLLKHGKVTHGYWLRSTNPREQLIEVITYFDLKKKVNIFSRCMVCNHGLIKIRKEEAMAYLEPKTGKYFDEFYQCTNCKNIYWKGSHYKKMMEFVNSLLY